jgi:uncharacterized membrane protein YkvA (DUF1232 family)
MNDPSEPEVALEKPRKRRRLPKWLKEALLLIPNLVRLIGGLVADKRVPTRQKVVLGAVLAYVASPVDLIPDFVPGIGYLDDLLLVALALDGLMNEVGQDVVMEHWKGDPKLLDVLQNVINVGSSFLPRRVRDRIFAKAGRSAPPDINMTAEPD